MTAEMSQDYNEHLAVKVLNEQLFVTYRTVSRALKVHGNVAKQMLYHFHRKQNGKKPGSVHATYLIAGTKHAGPATDALPGADGEDVVMSSSPPIPSSSFLQPHDDVPEAVPSKTVMVVREAQLDEARRQFANITGIHIYSLQATALGDFQLLTDTNRTLTSDYACEDPLKHWKQYGVIQNANVKVRTRRNAPPVPAAAASANKPEPPIARPVAAPPPKPAASKHAAATKKEGGLFKAFAKSAAKPNKAEPAAPAAPAEDVPMTGFSDDDDDDDDEEVDACVPAEPEAINEPSGPSRKDRKAELEAMMDEADESIEDAPESEPEPEPEEKHDPGALSEKAAHEPDPKETVTVENGRRRGRRRVMKKKTVKDAEGYLVTTEEPVWEEFSEDEPAPKKAKVSALAPPATKSDDKKAGKKGQGNITSFFGKK